jgi:predicted transcriptional regulator
MKKIIISKEIKIIQAMKKLALTGLRCLIVVDKNKKLLGTLSDG